MKYVLFTTIIFIIVIYVFRINLIYNISLIASRFTCDISNIKNYKLCNNIYINDNDVSGPANSERLGIPWELWLKNIIIKNRNKKKCAIDIGAHIGIHTIQLSKNFNKVYSFEPNINIFKNLKLNTKNLHNVYLYNNAVGDSHKMVNLVIKYINCQSYIEHFNSNSKQMIQQIKLDDIDIKDPVGFIKIDIEGGEINAFKGMYNLIQKYRPIIVFEDHRGNNIKYLKKTHNYSVTKMNSTNFIAQ